MDLELPYEDRLQVNAMLENCGFDLEDFDWQMEKSRFGSWNVSKLNYKPNDNYFFKFDVNNLRIRVSRYAPSGDDLDPVVEKACWGQEERLPIVATWLEILRRNLPDFAPAGPVLQVLESGKPHTAHLHFEDLFRNLKGDVWICDPYYGSRSLARLALLSAATSVRLLTQTPDSKEKAELPSLITDFLKEHSNVELSAYSGKDLHDRYLITAETFILLGHGLKDIGNKESFVVKLETPYISEDFLDELRQSFDSKWAGAKPLP